MKNMSYSIETEIYSCSSQCISEAMQQPSSLSFAVYWLIHGSLLTTPRGKIVHVRTVNHFLNWPPCQRHDPYQSIPDLNYSRFAASGRQIWRVWVQTVKTRRSVYRSDDNTQNAVGTAPAGIDTLAGLDGLPAVTGRTGGFNMMLRTVGKLVHSPSLL